MEKTYQDVYCAYALINKGKEITHNTPFKVTKVLWDSENHFPFIEMYDEEHGIHVRYSEAYIQIALLNEGRKLSLDLHPDAYQAHEGFWSKIKLNDFYDDNEIISDFRLSEKVEDKLADLLFAPWDNEEK